jgi:YesN/AraC family two-component response regulator
MGRGRSGVSAKSRARIASSHRPATAPPPKVLQSPRRYVILIVDDEPVARELFRRVLETDYVILEAPNGPAALKLLRSRQVDLVLLDVLLPGMDGIEILSRLRVTHPDTPVILVSGAATVPTAVTAMKLGAVDYLTKPFTNTELSSRVREALAWRSCSRPVQESDRRLLLVGTDPATMGTLHVAINTRIPVTSAWRVPDASEKVKSRSYAAIGLDDSITPLDALVFLRAVGTRVVSSSVVVLAAHHEPWTASEFSTAAISAIVPKPYRLNDLMEHLAATIDRENHAIGRFNSVIGRALDYFRNHFAGHLAFATVGPSIGVSPGHLASLFRADLDMTPRQFVARVRIEITKHLLRDTDMKIEAIADLVGFNDASHLSRVFKRYVKSRPGRFRH